VSSKSNSAFHCKPKSKRSGASEAGNELGLNGHGEPSAAKIRVMVIFGGESDEHDVSLRSAQTVIGALDPERYEILPVGITRNGGWITTGDPMKSLAAHSPLFALEDGIVAADLTTSDAVEVSRAMPSVSGQSVDVVFPVLHGPRGEDGTLQGMLELSGLPYVGSGVLGSAVAMDKIVAKTILAQAGIPQVEWMAVLRRDWERDPVAIEAEIAEKLGFPCFCKPANMGSSVGVTKAHDASELSECLANAAAFDRRIIVERGIDARELEVAVLGNDDPIVSVAGEIVPSREFYDYEAKYIDEGSQLLIPAPIDDETLATIQRVAVEAFAALDLAGMARADFFLDRGTNEVLLNEVNTIPGFTSISMYPLLWQASGVPLAELVDRLVALAIERHADHRREI
jgi:D-alanine-D-alanine ligase